MPKQASCWLFFVGLWQELLDLNINLTRRIFSVFGPFLNSNQLPQRLWNTPPYSCDAISVFRVANMRSVRIKLVSLFEFPLILPLYINSETHCLVQIAYIMGICPFMGSSAHGPAHWDKCGMHG